LRNQYIKLVKAVKNSDYIQGYNTSVSQSQMRELENIRDKFDNGSNINNSSESDVLRKIKEATQEIEGVLNQNGYSPSINDIIKYVKEKFYEEYAIDKEELESQNKVPLKDRSNIKNYKETCEFDDVKGKLNFQTAMDDLTRNYS
jgi:predicted RND superfamily exporter protein